MADIIFQKPTLEHRDLIQGYFDRFQSRSCERSFSNILLWSPFEPVTFAEVEGTLVFASALRGQVYYSWPAGEDAQIEHALEILEDLAREQYGQELRLYHLTPDNFERLEQMQPGRWEIAYNRDLADYVYTRESLSTLAGKKLHSKRNHINRFVENWPDWHYEKLCDDNRSDAERVAQIWLKENEEPDEPGKQIEYQVALNAIRCQEKLRMSGGVLYAADHQPVAFTIGEKLSDDTFVVHIEKAFANVQGAYPMINREFVRDACGAYTYVNREEDTGAEGLRKAKISYRPAFMVEKGIATIKGGR